MRHVTGLDIPIRSLLRIIRVPVMVHARPISLPASHDGNSPSNSALFLWNLSCEVEVACPRRACTFVRESPTRIRSTVPQKLHGSADCLPFTDVLSFVVWAGILSTSNPARNAATALPARLVAVGNYLRPFAEGCKRPASSFPSIQESKRHRTWNFRRPNIIESGYSNEVLSAVPTP